MNFVLKGKEMRFWLLIWILAACMGLAEAETLQEDRQRYVNELYGYEFIYSPARFEVHSIGSEGERDGARLSIRYREYAAPRPHLYIQAYPRVQEEIFFKAPDHTLVDIQSRFVVSQGKLAGTRGIVWRTKSSTDGKLGRIIRLELYVDGAILRFEPSVEVGSEVELYGTAWWNMIESFRFTKQE